MALTETQLQDQWRKAIDIVEQGRVFSDGLAGASNEFEALTGVLKGEFAPDAIAFWAADFRAICSLMTDSSRIYAAIAPFIQDYGKVLQIAGSIGSNYETVPNLMNAIYEHFIANALRVESRVLVLDTSGTVSGTGDGEIGRLILDESGFQFEGVHVEKKNFRCRRDQNTGVKKHAEEFEFIGETRSRDNLLNVSHGSGSTHRAFIRNRNAGGGSSGSLLRNSSFSSYDSGATNHFTSWELVSGANATQDTNSSRFYATYPGASIDASMLMAANVRYKQTITNMRVSRLKPFTPYFLRVMVNRDDGPGTQGTDGSFILHLGSRTVTQAINSLSAGWNEVFLPLDANSWFKNFALGSTSNDFDIEIEWTTRTSGDLLVDDMIFCELQLIDGSYWVVRMNDPAPVPWVVDDEVLFTDTQSDAAGGKINYYLFRAGLRTLPHTTGGGITFADP